jgi:predicted NBD/HSP70 family sugar kinase
MLGQALMLIHTGRAPTRSVLTSALGVTRATAGTVVSELQKLGLIQVDDVGHLDARHQGPARHGPAQQGRPSHRLSIDPAGPVALAAQLHPDGFDVALIGLGARVVAAQSSTQAISADPAAALAAIAAAAARLLADAGRPCAGAGLAVPSAVTSLDGTMVAPYYRLGWPTGTPVRDLFAGKLRLAGVTRADGRGLRCSAANDINLAALAEHRHGAGRGSSHLLVVATGHGGVGGALVIDGTLYAGSTGLGMEAGHVSVDTAGLPCPCGSRGCLSVEADAARFMALAGRAAEPGTPELSQAIAVLRRDYAGDPAVRAATATLIERLGLGLADLINVINPDRVLLGGLHRDLLEADPVGLRAAVAERSPWGRGAGVPLVPADLEQATLIGAAEIAWQPVLDDPASAAGTSRMD